MHGQNQNTDNLRAEIEALKAQLEDANNVIDAIRYGSVDALVLNKNGQAHVYSIESADYTYRVLIEKFGEGALSISDDGLILYCNDYFSKLIGIPSKNLVGTFFNTYFEAPERFSKLISDLGSGRSKSEIFLKGKERSIPVYISLTDLHPNVAAIGVVVTDLTDKIAHENALMHSQHDLEVKVNELNQTNLNLEQFIHVISHDLKEPLRKIVTYTSFLDESKSAAFNEKELKSLNVINSSAVRLNSLVDDLVKYAFSAIAVETATVDLNNVISEVIDDLELAIREKSASISCDSLPPIIGSKVQMRQLFSNLISNAIKYGREDIPPKVQISASHDAENGNLIITVSDNGIGMNPKHIGKIFTIFQRLHMRNEYTGNGIGLAICKKIMENHRGQITVKSEENKGSVFSLTFPNQT